MKHGLRLVVFMVVVAAVAVAACYFSEKWMAGRTERSAISSHYWIHSRLTISEQQDKALAPIEQKFVERRKRLTDAIQQANLELADAIVADKAESPRVNAAVEKIHRAQGELQQAVIEHVFDMRSVLTPEQYDRLLELTAAALRGASEAE